LHYGRQHPTTRCSSSELTLLDAPDFTRLATGKVVGLEVLNASLRVENPRGVDYAMTA
jgi:hypothetical protein